jgi:hypothetical protein
MRKYPKGLIISRILSAIGELENGHSSTCPDYATFMTNPMKHLRRQLKDAIECVCNQHGMSSSTLIRDLMVYEARVDYGEPWFVIRWDGEPKFQVNLPMTQIEHWFRKDA